MKILFTVVCLFLLLSGTTIAQRTCGTMENFEIHKANNPGLEQRMLQNETLISQWIQDNGQSRTSMVVTIPVVFHVVYNTTSQNISTAQVLSQLDVLNEDFARLNADTVNTPAAFRPLGANTQIQFCLAQRDPSGNPTSGIIRKSTSVTSFSLNDNVKYNSNGGSDAWDRNRYLNLWVCNLSSGLLGYAQFPGGAAATDGVVIGYRYCGRVGTLDPTFNKGRTATHEVGHWLGLYHIWGDDGNACTGSDQVADTPNQGGSTSGCPSFPRTDACSATSPGIMFMNYMDYSNDNCMNIFTAGQSTRMNGVLNTTRLQLTTSNGCVPVALQQRDAGIVSVNSPIGTTCSSSVIPVVVLRNYGSQALSNCTINYQLDGGTVNSQPWSGSLSSGSTVNVNLPSITVSAGSHLLLVYTTNPNGATDQNFVNDTARTSFSVSLTGQNLPFTEGFENIVFPPAGMALNELSPGNDTTWQRTTQAKNSGVASSYMNYFNYAKPGVNSDMILPNVNLTSMQNPKMTFYVAYRMYTNPTANPNFSDTLVVLISTNCGVSYSVIYKKFGIPLTTITPTFSTNEFIPAAANWRMETIDLAPYSGSNNAMIIIRAIGDYENNLYIDDINLTGVTDINKVNENDDEISVFPNPGGGMFYFNFNSSETEAISLSVYNVTGIEIMKKEFLSGNEINREIDLRDYAQGIYFLHFVTGKNTIIKKIYKSY